MVQHRWWELNLGPAQEQCVLLTTRAMITLHSTRRLCHDIISILLKKNRVSLRVVCVDFFNLLNFFLNKMIITLIL